MSELSDYKRIIVKPMIESFEATIAAQRAEIAGLREALRPFANARTPEGYFGITPSNADFMAARAALGLQVPATPNT